MVLVYSYSFVRDKDNKIYECQGTTIKILQGLLLKMSSRIDCNFKPLLGRFCCW